MARTHAELDAIEAEEERQLHLQKRRASIEAQAWWDPVYQKLGTRARAPVEGEDHWGYRADMAVQAKNNLPGTHPLTANLQLRRLARQADKSAFRNLEKQIHAAVGAYAVSNDSAPDDGLREVVEVNEANGMKIHKFLGNRCFTRDFAAPVRKVICFRTPQGAFDASGRPLR
jgi:hypothetical protein